MGKLTLVIGWKSEYAGVLKKALGDSSVRDFKIRSGMEIIIGSEETDIRTWYDPWAILRFQDRSGAVGYDELRWTNVLGQFTHVSNAAVSSTSRKDCGVFL
jgi:hypothetical protein